MATILSTGLATLVPLDGAALKFFGFSEFLTGLALIALAWTTADVRYRFRVRTAPLPLQGIMFTMVVVVGFSTLLADFWRSEGWGRPCWALFNQQEWQAILGGLFLSTVLIWAWFAFIRPPVYGKRNAGRFAGALYGVVLRGSASELSIIADELARSAKALVYHATNRSESKNYIGSIRTALELQAEKSMVTTYADDLLLLIADKRFCRAIVESCPSTALAFFHEIGVTKKYGIKVEIFAQNFFNEALLYEDSFLYHETEGYKSGLLGYFKPLSQAMFANYEMVETIGTLLDPDVWCKREWHSAQWEAYCRAVLITLRDYVAQGYQSHSFVLFRAKGNIERSVSDLYKLDAITIGTWDDDIHERLRCVVNFIKDAIKILDEKGVPENLHLRFRRESGVETMFDHLAEMIFEVIFSASAVKSPPAQCRWIQLSSVWMEFFNSSRKCEAAMVVQHKVRRLLYDEVAKMKTTGFPNFKGARILGFCLNVMGISVQDQVYFRDSRPLQKAILSWTKKNYRWLHSENPRVAEACLVDGITLDLEHWRLVRTHPVEGLRREPIFEYLDLDIESQSG